MLNWSPSHSAKLGVSSSSSSNRTTESFSTGCKSPRMTRTRNTWRRYASSLSTMCINWLSVQCSSQAIKVKVKVNKGPLVLCDELPGGIIERSSYFFDVGVEEGGGGGFYWQKSILSQEIRSVQLQERRIFSFGLNWRHFFWDYTKGKWMRGMNRPSVLTD